MSLAPFARPRPDDLPVAAAAEALPLPHPTWGTADALAALETARGLLGLGHEPARVVSSLSTVVLRVGATAVKVYPPATSTAHLDTIRRAMATTTTTVQPSAPVATPAGVVVTMPWLPACGEVTWTQVGALLRTFHDEATGLDLPPWTPLSRLPGEVVGLADDQAAVLLGARAELLVALSGLTSDLGVGPIHGDVSPGNVVVSATGPRLIDLDWVATAPREYDLASAARRRASGELSRSAYAGFCAAYGADVRGWDGLPVLDRVAELGAVAFRLWDSRRHGRGLQWLDAELVRWRTGL